MAGYAWTKDELQVLKDADEARTIITKDWCLKNLPGRSPASVRKMKQDIRMVTPDEFISSRRMEKQFDRPVAEPSSIPSAGRGIDALLSDLQKSYERKKTHHEAKKNVVIRMPDDGPYCAVAFGDPHVGDPGCDIAHLSRLLAWCKKTPRVHPFNVGDLTNNWVGGLMRLYAHQDTTASEEYKLIQWLYDAADWLFVIGGNHDCHDADTEALTRRGWMTHDQIRFDDEVLAFNQSNGTAQWEPICQFIRKRHTGTMVSVESQHSSLLMTEGHRVLMSQRDSKKHSLWHDWEYTTAGELSGRFRMPAAGIVEPAIESGIEDDWISLVGWVLTDCSYASDGRVTFYQSKDGSEIERLLDSLGLAHKKTVRHRDITHVCGKELKKPPLPSTEWRLTAEASRTVRVMIPTRDNLPGWAHSLSSRQFDLLLNAIVAGDGTWFDRHSGSHPTCTIHKKKSVLDQIQAVAIRHGWRAMLSVHRENEWRLNLTRKPYVSVEAKTSVTSEYYDGIVWCLTVPSGNFMVRRNGKALFSGNCWGPVAELLAKSSDVLYVRHGGRFRLISGECSTTIDCRHIHRGVSQMDPAFGPKKQVYRGNPADIIVSGDRHVSASSVIPNGVVGTICHAVRVGTFKVYDDFPEALGFDSDSIGPAAFFVVRPYIEGPGKVHCFWDEESAELFLSACVSEWQSSQDEE